MRLRGLKYWQWAIILTTFLASPQEALPQATTTGSITGLVKDATGAVVPSATVTAKNEATNVPYSAASSATGNYAIPNLPVGSYALTVSLAGFKTWTRSSVLVSSGEEVRMDVVMVVGEVAETIEVTGGPAALQTESTDVSSSMERTQVEELPIPVGQIQGVRTALSLMIMLPEVRTDTGEGSGNTPSMRIGGGQASGWSVNFDGQRIETGWRNLLSEQRLLTPPVDAIEQFRVDMGSYKASDPQAGGGSVTLVSKTGTNQFHGSAFEYYQSQQLNANSWLNNKLGREKSVFHRHDFGFTAGGPAYIPKLYNGKNRSYFFVAYEGYLYPQTLAATQNTVPTTAMRGGDFSGWVDGTGKMIPIYDPGSTRTDPSGNYVRDAFAMNLIPAGRISPISKKIASYYPDPNAPGLVLNYNSPGAAFNKRVEHIFSARGDQSFGTANRLAVTYTQARKTAVTSWDADPLNPRSWPGLPYPLGGQDKYADPERGDLVRVNDTHIVSPRMVNTLTFGYHKHFYEREDVSVGAEPWSKVLGGIGNAPNADAYFPIVTFSTDNYTGSSINYNDRGTGVFGVDERVSWVRGNHNVQFGYSWNRMRFSTHSWNNTAGTNAFHRLTTAVPADNSGRSGNSFASFLLGAVYSGSVSTESAANLIYPYHAFFAQDSWKVRPRITVNFGLRFELSLAAREADGRASYFDPALPNPAADGRPGALRFLGSGPGRDGKDTFYPATHTWGPRLGVAWQVKPATVIRMGAGIYYASNKYQLSTLGFSASPSWASGNQGVTSAYYWDQGYPDWQRPPFINPALNAGSSVSWADPGNLGMAPTNATWNFALSRSVRGNLVLELNYAGNKGTHLATNRLNYMQVNPQYAYLGSLLNRPIDDANVVKAGFSAPFPSFKTLMGSRATLAQSLRMFPQYSGVSITDMADLTGNSTYHALMVRATKRYSNGLSLLFSYVWSKTLTDADASTPGNANNYAAGIGAGPAQDSYNRATEKSYSVTDMPHVWKATFSYDLPLGKGRGWARQGVPAAILGGWNLAGYTVAQSGYPLGVLDSGYNNYLSGGPARPNVITYDLRAPIAGDKFDPDRDLVLNAGALSRRTNPAVDPFGNAPRFFGSTRWAGRFRENITLRRRFRLRGERLTMNVRWEIYDLFNNKTWANPASLDLANTQFGKVTNASGNRTMQLGARLQW